MQHLLKKHWTIPSKDIIPEILYKVIKVSNSTLVFVELAFLHVELAIVITKLGNKSYMHISSSLGLWVVENESLNFYLYYIMVK